MFNVAVHYGSTSSLLDSLNLQMAAYRSTDVTTTLGNAEFASQGWDMAIYVGYSEGDVGQDNLDIGMAQEHGETSEKNAWYNRCVVMTTQCMTTSATGEIQKYILWHSLCKYIMYLDLPDLYLRACQDTHQKLQV